MLGIRSFFQTHYWENSYTFFTHALVVNPNSWMAHNGLGNDLQKQGKLQEAIANYSRAIELNPHYAVAHSNLGVMVHIGGKLEEAIAHYS